MKKYAVRYRYFLGGATYYKPEVKVFDNYEDAQKLFLQKKDEMLGENELEEFAGQEWTDENIKALNQVLYYEEGFGEAEKDFVEINGTTVRIEEIS